MKTGFAKNCITPWNGVPIIGYYEDRFVKGVLDDLYVSAVSFEDGGKRAIVLAVDVCELSTAQCDKARAMISRACGVDPDSIFINCSHTHTGPMIGKSHIGNTDGDPKYDEFFFKSLEKTAAESFNDMRESRFAIGKGKAEGISFIRRYRMKSGKVQTNPGVENPDTDHPLGTPTDTVKIFEIDREDGDDIVIVSFGTHADSVGGELVSGDWPAFVCKTVEAAIPNVKCVFILGAQGDVNHINPNPTEGDRRGLEYDTFDGVPRGYEHAKHMGRKVAAAAIAAYGKTEPVSSSGISYGTKEIIVPANKENSKLEESKRIADIYDSGRASELPYEKMELTTVVAEAKRIIDLENGPESFPFVLSAIKLGEVTLAGLPGECFVEIGRTIERENGSDSVFVCCLTNGGDTYFPTSSAYDEGGYEARTSRLRKGGDKILVCGMSELLKSL